MSEEPDERSVLSRRMLLRAGAIGATAVGLQAGRSFLAPNLEGRGLWSPDGVFGAASIAWADAIYTEVFPTSPLILAPFSEELKPKRAERPAGGLVIPPSADRQNSFEPGTNNAQKHQIWCEDATRLGASYAKKPIVYQLDVNVAEHRFTESDVLAIDSKGQPVASFDNGGRTTVPAGTVRKLPASTRFQFAGGLPRINAEYHQPVVVRFTNKLDQDNGLDVQDFGAPDRSFLTHLHNGHTAPESDGNPHYSMRNGPRARGYGPGM
jgi:hypothetical protein